MKKLIIIALLFIGLKVEAQAGKTYWTPGAPPKSQSYSPTFRVDTTSGVVDSLRNHYFSNGNKWNLYYTAAQANARFSGGGGGSYLPLTFPSTQTIATNGYLFTIKSLSSANPALIVDGHNTSGTPTIQEFWYNGARVAAVGNGGDFFGHSLSYNSGGNYSAVTVTDTGTTISRKIADAKPLLWLENLSASSTGDYLIIKDSTSTKVRIERNGNVTLYDTLKMPNIATSSDTTNNYPILVAPDGTHYKSAFKQGGGGSGGVTSVTGTTNRITSTGGTTPVVDISASYAGQSSITTVGTLVAGVIDFSLLSGTPPTWNQNTTGTASNLSGTPTLPNGTAATTQAAIDNSTKLATTAFVQSAVSGYTPPVTSVFGRTGAVVAASNDYTFAQLASKPTTLSGYGITDAYPLSGNPSSFLTANQSITFTPTGDVTGTASGATSLTPTLTIGAGKVTNAMLAGSIDLTAKVTGVLPSANGGTSQSTYTTGDLLYASATNTLSKLGIGATGNPLTVIGGVPAWSNLVFTNPASAATFTLAAGKTLTVNNTLTVSATDGITMTTPTTSFTAARTDAANTFTGHQTIEGVTSTGATGTGRFVFDNNPQIVKLGIGVAASNSTVLNLASAATGFGQIRFATGTAPTSPVSGDSWRTTGSGLFFYDGTTTQQFAFLSAISSLTSGHTIFAPTTGGTVTLVTKQENIINPAGTLATLTLTLPSSPANNDVVYLTFTQAITTITYSGGTVVGGPGSATLGGQWHLTYDSGTTTWY